MREKGHFLCLWCTIGFLVMALIGCRLLWYWIMSSFMASFVLLNEWMSGWLSFAGWFVNHWMSSTQYSLVHCFFFLPSVGVFVRFLKLSVHCTLKFKINVDLSTEMTRQFYIQETGCVPTHILHWIISICIVHWPNHRVYEYGNMWIGMRPNVMLECLSGHYNWERKLGKFQDFCKRWDNLNIIYIFIYIILFIYIYFIYIIYIYILFIYIKN